jgi:ribosomal protein S18 acetylase RimI-like enzyme
MDVDFAYDLNLKEGWNNKRDDVKRMFSFDPGGCFIAEVDGDPVGHVFTINYDGLGWIGFLIIKTDSRKKGVGTLLMKQAMNHLQSREVKTVRLEAVPQIADLYRSLGFIDEYDSLRLIADGKKGESSLGTHVKVMKKQEIIQISEFDATYFGVDRRRVLQKLHQTNPRGCFISTKGSRIIGYIMSRKRESGYVIGPWVCCPDNTQVGGELLAACLKEIGEYQKVYVGVPAVNEAAVDILGNSGFKVYSRSVRMYWGKKLHRENVKGIFAIGGPEKG